MNQPIKRARIRGLREIFPAAGLLGGTLLCLWPDSGARAVELFRRDGAVLRWDNTLKYSGAMRLENPAAALIEGPNGDDGDRNFLPGFVSNRVDLLSELDLAVETPGLAWGAALGAAAWYDTLYMAKTDAFRVTPPGRYAPTGEFPPEVRELHGRKAEVLNAFVYAGGNVGDVPVSLRIGRHTLLWGESLFYAGNGIAAAQAPIDAIKALSVPAVRAKEVYMPVAQASVSIQLAPGISLSAYNQFEWRRSRLPGVGSYFSAVDFLDAGGELIYVARDQFLVRTPDSEAPDHGQFGIALRATGGAFDFGLYALRYHAREPQLYLRPNPAPRAAPSAGVARPAAYGTAPGIYAGPSSPFRLLFPDGFGAALGDVGSYALVYPQGIEVYGASFSGYLGDGNLAGEVSVRRRMPLVNTGLVVAPATSPDADDAPLYPRGDTLHGQISMVTALSATSLWDAANLSAELAANARLSVKRNVAVLDRERTRAAASLSVVIEPRYFAVLPGLDLGVPASVSYGLVGRSSVDGGQTKGTGSVSFGLGATYRAVWNASFGFTHFIGDSEYQPFGDRDFISFSIQRTF